MFELVDHVQRRPDVLQIVLALEDAHRLVDRDAALDHGGIGGRCEDLAAPDALIHARREVVGDDLDVFLEPARAQQAGRRLGRHRGADDVVDVRVGLERVFDQLELHLLAGIAVLGVDDLDRAALDRLLEALVAGLDPAGAGRAREPGDLDRIGARGMHLGEVLAGLVAHFAE